MKVLITGPLYGEDKLEAYVDADVYVLPSVYEIWGISALEAVACGTPVILTENCGIAEYLKDRVGLVTRHSQNELAKMLHEILQDAGLTKVFRSNCKKVMEELDISKVVPLLEEAYKEIIMQH